jgi:hypothetical protein
LMRPETDVLGKEINASVPKRSNGADCKSAGSAFTSSNLVRRTEV